VNGTLEWVVNALTSLVRGNAALVPWAIFLVTAIPTTAGALGPATVAMVAPILLPLARRYDISPRLAGLMVAHGSSAGNFSPVNPLGAIVNGTVQRSGFAISPVRLFVANFLYNVALGLVIYFAFGGLELWRRRVNGLRQPAGSKPDADPYAPQSDGVVPDGATTVHVTTLACIVVAATGALVFRLDLGMLVVTAAVMLQLLFPATSRGALARVSWSTVLLICGIITYMTLLQRMGTIQLVGDTVARIGTPRVGTLLVCAIAAVTSAFASSTAVLGTLIPLSIPLLNTGEVPVTGLIIALAISATVVDATPFSNVGALVVASTPQEEQEPTFRAVFLWGMVMVATAPLATWVAFILIG
jgi:di/tricarboxylate transporter